MHWGVDYSGNKDRPEGKTIQLDATTQWGQRSIRREAMKSDYVPMAPPCGTASKSRERRMKTGPDPKPLRSDWWPEGLPWLKGVNKSRVHSANKLYKFVAELVEELDAAGISWSVENPRNSYMWKTIWFKRFLAKKHIKFRWMHTQMCMQGGRRNKWTTLLHGGPINLMGMSKICDGHHEHAPWGALKQGGFATAEERNYPKVFCNRIARKAAKDLGIQKEKKVLSGVEERIGAGVQPRRAHNDLVPEYAEVLSFANATDK